MVGWGDFTRGAQCASISESCVLSFFAFNSIV